MHSFKPQRMNVRVVQSHKAYELSSSTMYPKNIVEMPKRINNPIFFMFAIGNISNHILYFRQYYQFVNIGMVKFPFFC